MTNDETERKGTEGEGEGEGGKEEGEKKEQEIVQTISRWQRIFCFGSTTRRVP